MNTDKLNVLLDLYVERYRTLNDVNGSTKEFMKYEAIAWFQSRWDPTTSDFKKMFLDATYLLKNKYELLIDRRHKYEAPLQGIINLLEHDTEVQTVKQCFLNLFSNHSSLILKQASIDKFTKGIDDRLKLYYSGTELKTFEQKRKGTIFYLNLFDPANNYIFRYREAEPFARYLECDRVEAGSDFSLERYYYMCDQVLEVIKNRPDVIAVHKRMIEDPDALYPRQCNDNLHLLVFDIIYCFHTYDMYQDYDKQLRIKRNKAITDKLDDLHEKLSAAESRIRPLPDLTGEIIQHKTFGSGTVTSFSEEYITIAFQSGEKKFLTESAFKIHLHTDNQEFLDTLRENFLARSDIKEYNEQIEQLENRLKA